MIVKKVITLYKLPFIPIMPFSYAFRWLINIADNYEDMPMHI